MLTLLLTGMAENPKRPYHNSLGKPIHYLYEREAKESPSPSMEPNLKVKVANLVKEQIVPAA